MNYSETINYLFNSAPMFQNVGAGAYKEGLSTTHKLDDFFSHPHRKYHTIHVAGTNGKGSTSHTLAAILQSAGYKVGLFTSPHLIDFRERIRVNGVMMGEMYVIDFVENYRSFFEPLHPSFFELTTALALKYFADQQVDVAVIEVGLGGRMDCTNIISPDLSIITNISFDHVQFLGDTLSKIASEKAGIIKQSVPVIIGESHSETRPVFESKTKEVDTDIIFAEDNIISLGNIQPELKGLCQKKNSNTILHAISVLENIPYYSKINQEAIKHGFEHVCELTGLQGRWQIVSTTPLVICDTGHNIGGFEYISQQLKEYIEIGKGTLRVVIGMVNDKDVSGVLKMLPKEAVYYFTQASVKRALPANEMQQKGREYELIGRSYCDVFSAYNTALNDSEPSDFIYVGGSTFVVADFLTFLNNTK